MDIKKKFQSLVKPRGSKNEAHVNEDFGDTTMSCLSGVSVDKIMQQLQANQHDPRIDQENIDKIERDYYSSDDSFDPTLYEINKLKDDLSLNAIEENLSKLQAQYKSVSKKVAELILENHSAYDQELRRVMELQQELQIASIICSDSRISLQRSETEFTEASLIMLAKHRRRQRHILLVKSIKTIKTLQSTDKRLMEMLEKEDFAGAIELCLECLRVSSVFRHYKCISELSSKLSDTLEMIEDRLDTALSKTCKSYDDNNYQKIQSAYQLLDKTQTAMDQLHLHYTSSIHNTAFVVVLGYVELISGTGDGNFQKKQYADLCKHLKDEHISYDTFMPCLRDLCKAMWNILYNYHMTRKWHQIHHAETENGESDFTRKYIEQKLEHGTSRLWQDIQLKFKSFLLAIDMSCFKFNEFTAVLNLMSLLREVGGEFSTTKSEILQEAMHQQTQNYFKQYHTARLEELRMFLDNEGWQNVPVRSSFTILNLQEFSFMRHSFHLNRKSPSQAPPTSYNTDQSDARFFDDEECPFLESLEGEITEDFLADGADLTSSDEDIDDQLKVSVIDDGTDSIRRSFRRHKSRTEDRKKVPTLTNTSLTVLRLFGKYMRMMSLLEPISFEVIQSLSQLFDYYLYSVYMRFAKDNMEDDKVDQKPCVSSKLQTTIERITAQFNKHHSHPSENGQPLYNHTLEVRAVAMESLVYLSEQLIYLQSFLQKIIPNSKEAFLQQFYSQTVQTASELRYPVYRSVTHRVLDIDAVVTQMTCIKWDLKEIMSDHNRYVDHILRGFQLFSKNLTDIDKTIRLPEPVRNVLWEQCSKNAARLFVEGFSAVKKCTNEGRALMQLDYQQFLVKFESISNLRPVPGRDYVVNYITAFYLSENQLETWTKEHKEYTPRQLISAVNCVPHLNKKNKARITSQIDDPDRIVRRTDQINATLSQLTANISKKHLNTSRNDS